MFAALALGAIVYAFLPKPIPVEVVRVARGPLQVTVDHEGRTRVKERYVISAPLSGRLLRVELHPGDPIRAKETLLASIEPSDPALLDPRARAEAEARVKAAEAAELRSHPDFGSCASRKRAGQNRIRPGAKTLRDRCDVAPGTR